MSVSNILLKTGANAGKIDPIYIIGGGGGGGVASVTASAGAFVDNTDALNPIVGVGTLVAGDLVVGTAVPHIGAVLQQGANGTFLGVAGGALGYQSIGGSGAVSATLPLVENAVGGSSQVSINFQGGGAAAAGQIPYGTGVALTGALTNVPTSGTQFLGVSAGVPAWKDLGASGTITATAPLVESAGAGNASNIAINFTATTGEIPVGNGTASTGVLLPKGTEGQILSVASTGTGGLKWIDNTQHTGQEVIVRSNAITLPIAPPQDPKDTLILVAEETTSSWDAIAPISNFAAGDYNLEFQTGYVGPPGGQTNFTGLVNTIGGFRVVELWEQILAEPTKIGYFTYIGYQYGETQPSADSFIRVANAYGNTGSNLDSYVIVGGTFNTFIYTNGSGNPTLIAYNICRIQIGGVGSDLSNLPTQSANNCGVGFDWAQRDAGGGFGVFSINYIAAGAGANPRPTLWVMGNFTSVLLPDTQTSTDGYKCMLRYFPEANGTAEYQTVANTVDLGYGLVEFPSGLGIINDAYFYGNYCAVVGSFTVLCNGPFPANLVPVPAGMTGFAVMDLTAAAAARWGATPTGPILVGLGNCIRPSQALAGYAIIGQSAANPGPVLYDTATNITSQITPSSPATFPAGMLYNSVASGTMVIVGGNPAVVLDALYMITSGNQPSCVYYLETATGAVAQLLIPTPTGVVVSDINGIMSSYGIQNFNSATIGQSLVVSGSTSLYQYNPATPHPNIDFTLAAPNGFRQGNTITNTARFAQPAYESQSYISSADKIYWIQTGGTTTGLTYI
jgi:hypothetical protein|nr:MAG: hypothetical protein [Lake Baikal virophage 7]